MNTLSHRKIPICLQPSVLPLNYKEDVTLRFIRYFRQTVFSDIKMEFEVARMEPLFAIQDDYDAFTAPS